VRARVQEILEQVKAEMLQELEKHDRTNESRPSRRKPNGRRKAGYKEIARAEDKCSSAQIRKKEDDDGKKIFVGNVLFADLAECSVPNYSAEDLEKIRIKCFRDLLQEFGTVQSFKPRWGKRYCHVVYASKKSAQLAFETLRDFEERKQRESEFKRQLLLLDLPEVAAFRSNFYVRWARDAANKAGGKRKRTVFATSKRESAELAQRRKKEGRKRRKSEERKILYWYVCSAADFGSAIETNQSTLAMRGEIGLSKVASVANSGTWCAAGEKNCTVRMEGTHDSAEKTHDASWMLFSYAA